jgi:hypothetical protein
VSSGTVLKLSAALGRKQISVMTVQTCLGPAGLGISRGKRLLTRTAIEKCKNAACRLCARLLDTAFLLVSRYAAFNRPKTSTSQGWGSWEVCDSRWQRIVMFSKQCFRTLSIPKPSQISIRGSPPVRRLVWASNTSLS